MRLINFWRSWRARRKETSTVHEIERCIGVEMRGGRLWLTVCGRGIKKYGESSMMGDVLGDLERFKNSMKEFEEA